MSIFERFFGAKKAPGVHEDNGATPKKLRDRIARHLRKVEYHVGVARILNGVGSNQTKVANHVNQASDQLEQAQGYLSKKGTK